MECVSRAERRGWNRVLNDDPFEHALTWGGLDWYRVPPDG
jgi:hypothetical protein